MQLTGFDPKDTQTLHPTLLRRPDGRGPVSSALLGEQSCIHSGKNVVERNHFHSSGIDRVEAEQDLAVPGCLDSSSILAAIAYTLPERLGQQDTLICWKLDAICRTSSKECGMERL